MRLDDEQGHVLWFECACFTSCFASSGTAFLFFLARFFLLFLSLLIPVELCKYSRTSWRSLQNVHARSLNMCQLTLAWAEKVLVQSLQELAQ